MGNDISNGGPSLATTLYRSGLAVLSILLVTVYTLLVVTGIIPHSNRVDAVHLGLIAIGAVLAVMLLKPDAFRRLQIVQLGDLKLEIREVKESQELQADRLNEMNLVLSILLPENERAHLLNLSSGATKDYKGGLTMRTELRR